MQTSDPPTSPDPIPKDSTSHLSPHDPQQSSASSRGRTISSHSGSTASTLSYLSGYGRGINRDPHDSWRHVRVAPTWAHPSEAFDSSSTPLLPQEPIESHGNTAHDEKNSVKSLTHHGARDRLPPFVRPEPAGGANRWQAFVADNPPPTATSSHHPHTTPEKQRQLEAGRRWLEDHAHDLDGPWLKGRNVDDDIDETDLDPTERLFFRVSKKRRKNWYKRFLNQLLNSPLVPLSLRSGIWLLSLVALGLSGSIFALSNRHGYAQRPSTLMAVIVDAIALIYLVYITVDEYRGKPLGLRGAKAKMRLIFCDVAFIIFHSANLSLAYDALYDPRWTCLDPDEGDYKSSALGTSGNVEQTVGVICRRQRALTSFLFIGLCAWVLTFTVSIVRVVERVSRAKA